MQIGQGVTVADVATQFSQGSLESTSSSLDLAIDGGGFFIVEDSEGSQYYTRAGAFHIDGEGYLVDVNDCRVQGYAPSSPALGDINTRSAQSAPDSSTSFSVGLNLDARTDAGDTFYSSQTVYDSLGAAHTLAATYMKTEGEGQWGMNSDPGRQCRRHRRITRGCLRRHGKSRQGLQHGHGHCDLRGNRHGRGHPRRRATTARFSNTGNLVLRRDAVDSWSVVAASSDYDNATVTSYGTLGSDDTWPSTSTATAAQISPWPSAAPGPTTTRLTIPFTSTEVDPADITVTFSGLANGATIGASGALTWDLTSANAETISGYASSSTVKALTNDGYPSGVLRSLAIEKDGNISGFFTNGQTASLGQLCLADFPNPWGLKKMGSNLFSSTLTSGQAIVNTPGAGGLGEVTSNALEMSNTDLGTEFIGMITAQRAYQASAKVITTTDAMMAELMNIKR